MNTTPSLQISNLAFAYPDGNLPSLGNPVVTTRQWITALSLPGIALSISLLFLAIGW